MSWESVALTAAFIVITKEMKIKIKIKIKSFSNIYKIPGEIENVLLNFFF